MITGYNSAQAGMDLRNALANEIRELTELILNSASSNIRYYPDVRIHLNSSFVVLSNGLMQGEVTADHWKAFLEQFGKGSLMAGPRENPGLVTYMNSDLWNRLRSRGSRIVVGRPKGSYRSIDGSIQSSGGGRAGQDLEELAERGVIDKKFGPTPPTFFLRKALQSNRERIMQGLSDVVANFPYHKYFITG